MNSFDVAPQGMPKCIVMFYGLCQRQLKHMNFIFSYELDKSNLQMGSRGFVRHSKLRLCVVAMTAIFQSSNQPMLKCSSLSKVSNNP